MGAMTAGETSVEAVRSHLEAVRLQLELLTDPNLDSWHYAVSVALQGCSRSGGQTALTALSWSRAAGRAAYFAQGAPWLAGHAPR
jgi:hypothetical protein